MFVYTLYCFIECPVWVDQRNFEYIYIYIYVLHNPAVCFMAVLYGS